ncbi:MAG TPA: S1 RNA-binding domain-containing protein [Candidatus Nanoarchaeia archaeon]|nr:S1 RNA-binding domain-containing protein [Candidatus Nanoarchaeia archaeon]
MFYKKQGYPNNGEIVLCTVNKILLNSIFVSLDEYKNREGLIHISEVSPGRIRNIREFVVIGKKIVCKVLRVDTYKGQIDLSLRRVSINLKKNKLNYIHQEERAERILEIVGKKLNKNLETMYKEVGEKIISNYGSLMDCFQSIVADKLDVKKELTLDGQLAEVLIAIVKENIKPPEVILVSKLVIRDYSPDGIENIKKILDSIKEIGKKNKYDLELAYLGAPNYRLKIRSPDFKQAEKIFKKIAEEYNNILKTYHSEGEIISA